MRTFLDLSMLSVVYLFIYIMTFRNHYHRIFCVIRALSDNLIYYVELRTLLYFQQSCVRDQSIRLRIKIKSQTVSKIQKITENNCIRIN